MNRSMLKNVWLLFASLTLGTALSSSALAFEVLDNDLLRFGTGAEASVNTSGNLQQPFYFDPNIGGGTFAKLTFSDFPLDNAIGIDGDGTNNWNLNGTIQENSALTGQVLDVSGFTITSGSKGTGTIISTGTVTIAAKTLLVSNTYELLPGKSFIKIITRVTNTSGVAVSNLRYWVGTRDDFVGLSDSPTKERGNLVNGAFEILANAADQSAALRITTATSGVLFFSTSPKANTSIEFCCSFSNAYGQDPATSAIIQPADDGSYALFIRMADLADGASEEFTWFYAAGEVGNLDAIAADVAAAAVVGKNLDEDTTATFGASDFVDTNDVTLEKIRIATLPAQGTLKLSGVNVTVAQEILSADYGNLTYTPVANFHGNDVFTFEAFVDPAFLPATNANLIVAAVNDAPTGTVSITGTPFVGQTLTAQNTLADIDGLGALSYQWQSNGVDIVGATASTYAVVNGDLGTAIRVGISYTDGDATLEGPIFSAPRSIVPPFVPNVPHTGGVSISGVAEENETLTAVSTLADADGLGTFVYQWFRNGEEIPGATAEQYTTGDRDVSAILTVRIRYVDGAGFNEQATSAGFGPIGPADSNLAYEKRVFFANPADNPNQQTFLRLINPNAVAVTVELRAFDDTGTPAPLGTLSLVLPPRASQQLNADDLEHGNPAKGTSGQFGDGIGKWQIKVASSEPIEIMSLIRTPDGFLTNASELVPRKAALGVHEIYLANSVENQTQQSFIRVSNRTETSGTVTVTAVDDEGQPAAGGVITFVLAANASNNFNSLDFSLGNPGKGLTGAFGSGVGAWHLSISSPLSLEVMSMSRTPDGFVTNLSAIAPSDTRDIESDRRAFIVNPASNTAQQSQVRIINDTDQSGPVIVSANDDLGARPINQFIHFDIGPHESKLLTAADLENGNPAKGLSGGFGTGSGRWQVTVSSDLDLKVQNLLLTSGGFLTNLSAVAPKPSRFEANVLTFNPASNPVQLSRLRIVNKSEDAGSILISGFDDAGQPAPGGSAIIDIGARAAVELTSQDLEQGNSAIGLQGALGDGEGKWRLSLSADVDIEAQSLLETPSGFLTNLSAPVQ